MIESLPKFRVELKKINGKTIYIHKDENNVVRARVNISKDFEETHIFDEKHNLIYYGNSDNLMKTWRYDHKKRMIEYKCSDGYEETYGYFDDKKYVIYKNSDGEITKYATTIEPIPRICKHIKTLKNN